ncbi:gibberellin 20-oxidase-like protein [Rutidosis leptorrhynchoides]|uniref:gibberellin 20-oxidase-like protein n=1 Tax=Rutidosis leptorrhynchoides TaxID=125765 RepID=UPI003A997107
MSELGEQTSLQLPILDVSQPLDNLSLSSLAQGCKKWGFFFITNHGVSKDLYDRISLLSKQAFSLPSETKLQLSPISYVPHFIASPFFESFRISGPDFFDSARSSADTLFDHQSHDFSALMQEYCNKMTELSKKITEILLMCLGEGFNSKFLESEFKNCHGYLRIINYSPPEILENDVEGLGMHTDISCLTVLYPDKIGQLQVKSTEGNWTVVNFREDAMVVNIGDMLQAWSNDELRSSEHRVVLNQPLNRFSLAFFWCFEDDKVISAPDEVVGSELLGNRRVYKPFLCKEYTRFRETREKGKFEKIGYTVKDFAKS